MPKFLYTISLGAIISWVLLLKVMHSFAPGTLWAILLWLFLFFCGFSLTSSLIIFLLKKPNTKIDNKILFRRCFKSAATAGIAVTSLIALKMIISFE